jgi:phytoene synthase
MSLAMTTDAAPDHHLEDAYAHVDEMVRRLDKERYLAGLFAPEDKRAHLFALYAFSAEIARIRDVVSDPLPGEVRARWWADMLEGKRGQEGENHPAAAALVDTISRFKLPLDVFDRLIEARIFDLYDDPMPTMADLETYCDDTSGALVRLSALVLADGRELVGTEVAHSAGLAWGLTGLMRALPFHASRGQIFLPNDLMEAHRVDRAALLSGRTTPELLNALAELRARARAALNETRRRIKSIPPECASAFLVVSLVEPILDRMDRSGFDPMRHSVEWPQWRTQLRLWRAARRARRAARLYSF